MGDWSKPTVLDTYTNILSYIDARLLDLFKGSDPTYTTVTNAPTNATRWNSSSAKWEKYNGTAWADLASTYAINISGNAASASSVSWSSIYAKPITLAGYGIVDAAPLYSPALTGTPTASTASVGTSTTQLATTEFATKYCRGTKIHELTASVLSGVMTINTSATQMDFRSSALSTGTVTQSYVPSLTISVPAAASLGLTTGSTGRIAVVVFMLNNVDIVALGTSFVLGVVNLNTDVLMDEGTYQPTALSSSSTSRLLYSSQALTTATPFRIVGYIDANWISGGNGWMTGWMATPKVQGAGSAEMVGQQMVGVNQKYDTTTQYTSGTTYTNNRSKPITIYAYFVSASAVQYLTAYVDGVQAHKCCAHQNQVDGNLTLIVPPRSTFAFSNSGGSCTYTTLS
jgi:hypothetical protein